MKRQQMGRAVYLYILYIYVYIHCCLSITKGSPTKIIRFFDSISQTTNTSTDISPPPSKGGSHYGEEFELEAGSTENLYLIKATDNPWLLIGAFSEDSKGLGPGPGPKKWTFWRCDLWIFSSFFFFLKVEFFVCLEHSKKTWKRLGKHQGFQVCDFRWNAFRISLLSYCKHVFFLNHFFFSWG